MPPDVLLVLASSGITLVASLLFFVSEDCEPVQIQGIPVQFCLPPKRPLAVPPPLPVPFECAVDVSTQSLHSVMTLKPQGGRLGDDARHGADVRHARGSRRRQPGCGPGQRSAVEQPRWVCSGDAEAVEGEARPRVIITPQRP